MKRLFALLLSMIMVLSIVGCGAQTEKPEEKPAEEKNEEVTSSEVPTVKIGALLPLSGAYATAGETLKASMEYSVDIMNNELGGIQNLNGAKVEIIFGDTQGDAEAAITEFDRMVTEEKVDILVGGHNTGVSNTLSQYVLANDQIILFDAANGADCYRVDNDNIYHIAPTNAQMQVATDAIEAWRRENFEGYKGGKVFAYVYAADDYGRTAYETQLASMEAMGIEEIVGIAIESGTSDFSSQMMKLKGRDDIEYITTSVGTQDAQTFLKQMKEYEIAIPLFANGAGFMVADFLEQVGDAGDYIYSGSSWVPDNCRVAWDPERAEEVNQACYDMLGFYSDESWAYGWEAIWTIWDVLERTESMDKADLKAAFKSTDISGDHMALLMCAHERITFETVTVGEDTFYNQCPDLPTQFCMAKDGKYRIVWPEHRADPEYPHVYPVPAWSER